MSPSRTRRRRGFTLIEVLLVLVILVVLASMAVMAYGPIQLQSKVRAARAQIGLLKTPLENFQINHGQYPPQLELLWMQPGDMSIEQWGGPYLDTQLPADPWGQPYQYVVDPAIGRYEIWSAGPDGISGNDDDIRSQ